MTETETSAAKIAALADELQAQAEAGENRPQDWSVVPGAGGGPQGPPKVIQAVARESRMGGGQPRLALGPAGAVGGGVPEPGLRQGIPFLKPPRFPVGRREQGQGPMGYGIQGLGEPGLQG